MPKPNKSLEIHLGTSIGLKIKEDLIIAIVSKEFDLVDDFSEFEPLINEVFDEIYVYELKTQKTFWHACVLISFLQFNSVFQIKESTFFNRKKIADITRNINNLQIDFHCHDIKAKALDSDSSRKITADINKKYCEKLAQEGYLLELKSKDQASVRNLFNAVGLVNDLIVRDPGLSDHPYWSYPFDNKQQTVVRCVDIRLYYADLLIDIGRACDAKTYLEVGAGTGFVTHYLAAKKVTAKGSELSAYRVKSARLLGRIKNTTENFEVADLRSLPYEDDAFDVVYSCFVLEQCQEILSTAIDECLRVALKKCVFYEPSTEFFSNLPSYIHNHLEGQPTYLGELLRKKKCKVSIIRPRFSHIYNTGCIFVVEPMRTKKNEENFSVHLS